MGLWGGVGWGVCVCVCVVVVGGAAPSLEDGEAELPSMHQAHMGRQPSLKDGEVECQVGEVLPHGQQDDVQHLGEGGKELDSTVPT